MKALDFKLSRDLWRMRGQVLAIAVVLGAAIATFVLSMGVHRSLAETRDTYYTRNGFADVFAGMTRAPRSIVARVAQIPGVRRAEGSIQQYGTLDLPGVVVPARALINSINLDGSDRLNRLLLREGRMPRPGAVGDVVADEAFAEATGFGPGDEFDAQIYGNRQRLKIVGTGLAPNYIYTLPPGDLVPDNSRFGVFWMGEQALEAATDRTEAINALSLTLERGASQADVIRAVDKLLEPYGGTGAYGRKDHLSHAFLDNELKQLEALTTVIPPVFLLVSTFLVYIVLGRMVRTERSQIGLIKAFGYSGFAIGWHYLKFALTVAALATLIGSLAGIWMGRAMTETFAQYYRFPFLHYRIAPGVFFLAGILGTGAASLGALGGMRSAITLNPAVAMSPSPPPIYRAGLAERLGRKAGLSAIGHMIVRHVARWPGRSAITVLGVALSLALLFSTIQFLDSSRSMLDTFFYKAQRQDMSVTFTEARNQAVLHELAQIEGVRRAEAVRAIPVELSNGNRVERTAIESTDDHAVLTARIDGDGRIVTVPPVGLMLSRQLANQLGTRAGEKILVRMLGGRRTVMHLPVSRVIEEYVGARAYASQATLEEIARDATPVGSALLRIDPAARESILTRLKDMPVVLGVSERKAAMVKFEEIIDENINTMLLFYIAFASAIAVGVVYNSARILFSERVHELATLRVLGYFRSEVGIVLIGELALLVVLAVPLGCILGNWLAQIMTTMFSSDLFRLPFAPARSSYGWSTVVVLISAMLTAIVVARRVLNLDMVRVLKAHD